MGLGLVDKPHLLRFKGHIDTLLSRKVNKTDYATQNNYGIVKPDGQTTFVNNGVMSAQNYVLPTATKTTLGGVKIDGETITINSGVISATNRPLNYSTTEQDTGVKWIDDHKVYQITFSGSVSCLSGQWNEVATAPNNLSKLIDGIAYGSGFICRPDIKVENGKIYVYRMSSFTLTALTIQYLKDSVTNYLSSKTWDEASAYTWDDLTETRWEDNT